MMEKRLKSVNEYGYHAFEYSVKMEISEEIAYHPSLKCVFQLFLHSHGNAWIPLVPPSTMSNQSK